MNAPDRDRLFTIYIRCYMDQISLLERLYLHDSVQTAEEILKIEDGISRFQEVMRRINKHIKMMGQDPIATVFIKNWLGTC